MDRLTLDTNLLLEYWKEQDKRETVERLLAIAESSDVDLAVISRIREDIPNPPLSERINRLDELQVTETGSVTRLGSWQLGVDQLGHEAFVEFLRAFEAAASESGSRTPDWRDWDHIHAHFLQGRDVFLTWDQAILDLSDKLHDKFGIRVMAPEVYLDTLDDG